MKGGEARKLAQGIQRTGRGESKAPKTKELRADLARFAVAHFGGNVDEAMKYITGEDSGMKKVHGSFVNDLTSGAKNTIYQNGQKEAKRQVDAYVHRRSDPAPTRRDDTPAPVVRRRSGSRSIEDQVSDAADAQRRHDADVLAAARERASGGGGRRGRHGALIAPIAALSLGSAMHGAPPTPEFPLQTGPEITAQLTAPVEHEQSPQMLAPAEVVSPAAVPSGVAFVARMAIESAES